jgi:hypothetical protein
MTTRQEVYAAIDSERDYQQRMAGKAHGDPTNDYKKTLETFVLYMDDYMRELKEQLSRTWGPDAYEKPLDTLRKVVAIGVSAMETWGAPQRVSATPHSVGTDLTAEYAAAEKTRQLDHEFDSAIAQREALGEALERLKQKVIETGAPLVEAPDAEVN